MSRPRRDLQTKLKTADPQHDPRRSALIGLLAHRGIPDKAEILRVKSLIRELAEAGNAASSRQPRAEEFISAYFDLYLGRVTGDEAIEKSALRQCLDCLGTGTEETIPELTSDGIASSETSTPSPVTVLRSRGGAATG